MDTKETLNYVVEDEILAELLGEQNFSTKESAVLEVIKNAYDADASVIKLSLRKTNQGNCLVISDDGDGMDETVIKKSWMYVGKTSRGYESQESGRVYAGAKGIGRFALARLGAEIELFSKKEDGEGLVWRTNWKQAVLEKNQSIHEKGTQIYIYKLRDKWSKRFLVPLVSYLSKVYNDTEMKIIIEFENEIKEVPKLWMTPKIGENYVASLELNYNSEKQTLNYKIKSDEFNETVDRDMGIDYEKEIDSEINVHDSLKNRIKVLLETEIEEEYAEIESFDDEVPRVLSSLGSFSGSLYFSFSSTSAQDYEWYDYKYKNLVDRYEPGVILYRNAFSIDSFEGRRDWLRLAKRASSSPAAASHPTGKWRVRTNQLSGYIVIDKNENSMIKDLSNRQGIVENLYFSIFNMIILLGLSEFESYRQNIIRPINAYKKSKEQEAYSEQKDRKEAERIVKNIKKNHEKFKDLSKEDVELVISEFDRKKTENEYIKRERDEIEKGAKYDVQLLNVLATSHLKIISLGHEINNDRNNIVSVPADLEEAIKELGVWEELCDESVPFYQNIPKLLDVLKENTQKILNLTDSILEETEKQNFENKEYDIVEVMNAIIDRWRREYNWVSVELDITGDKRVIISYDQLLVIFNNLILNSIQQNGTRQELKIRIKLNHSDGDIRIKYQDDGVGLEKKYRDRPKKILEVHESSRDKGHGLGMWIVNNTITKLRGEIEEIKGDEGFMLSAFIKVEEGKNGQ